ncbi:hypothetical protein E4P39_14045 [Blastococcus sp. CT_GayMR19]|uniref:hypothetical protein n=1 Tax=Blastococcus sp. CT_GayMR19 TaxID=2559608 RepID=UPI0010749D5B|nr:hypothetical protein [Blastococcus sp. CT_GayMR19]TFV73873.1 hypothetical protein E4P39_14045 [Blastococcus sp. CT_GayMR19]
MTTSPNTQTPAPRRPQGWRLALLASGATLLAGGPMHPDSDASGSMREELATMTADEMWVPGHTLVVIGTVLLVVGLWMARRRQVWPQAAGRPLAVAVVALSLYAVETVFHLAAVVDSHALDAGHAAPVAFTHLGLAAVLYPVSGLAVVYLATTLARIQGGLRRVVALLGVVGGLAHAVVVPLTFLSPDTEFTPLFAVAGVLLALWALGTAATGARAEKTAAPQELASVG